MLQAGAPRERRALGSMPVRGCSAGSRAPGMTGACRDHPFLGCSHVAGVGEAPLSGNGCPRALAHRLGGAAALLPRSGATLLLRPGTHRALLQWLNHACWHPAARL